MEQPLFLCDVLFQNVVLDGAAELRKGVPRLRATGEVHGEEYGRRPIDRHRGCDLIQRNAVEKPLHVGQRRNRDAATTHFAQGRGSSESGPISVGKSKATLSPV